MDQTEQAEHASSSELTAAAIAAESGVDDFRAELMEETGEALAIAERQAEAKEIAESLAGKRTAEAPKPSRYSPVTLSPVRPSGESSPVAEFVGFLKQTNRVWLMVVGAIVGLVALVTVAQRGFAWFSEKRERKQEQAVASVTPEHLLARCGQPLEDTTKSVYPILMRTMTYHASRKEAYIFDFSRTAEETSDWVFLSMKDGGRESQRDVLPEFAEVGCSLSRSVKRNFPFHAKGDSSARLGSTRATFR